MKSKKALLSLTLLMALSLPSCGKENTSSSSEPEKDDVSTIVQMIKISQRKSFTMFNANKKEKENSSGRGAAGTSLASLPKAG